MCYCSMIGWFYYRQNLSNMFCNMLFRVVLILPGDLFLICCSVYCRFVRCFPISVESIISFLEDLLKIEPFTLCSCLFLRVSPFKWEKNTCSTFRDCWRKITDALFMNIVSTFSNNLAILLYKSWAACDSEDDPDKSTCVFSACISPH